MVNITDDNRVVNTQLLIRWLVVMAEGMEFHRDDLYFQGAAKSYRTTAKILELGIFQERSSKKNEEQQ